MAKEITIAKYDIDIENIQKKIQQVQNDLSSSEMKSFIPKTILKDMDDLQKKLEKFRKTSPVSTSTHKDIEKFLKEWERVSIELDDLDSKMSKISFSDTGIKENIKEVSELVNKYKEAVKARKDYAEKITSESGVKNVSGGIYRAKLETKRNKMAEAATKGGAGVEEIKTIAQDGRSELKERLDWINQNRTNPEIIKKETKEVEEQLKLWNAIEQSALRYAENQQRNINNEKEINNELQEQIQLHKENLDSGLEQRTNDIRSAKEEAEKTTSALKQMSKETLRQEERQSNIDTMTSRIKDLFSAATAIATIRHIVRGAIQDFQELDKQFNEIAIVSDYTTQEMWESFSDVNKVAQDFGVETKNVLEVQNLYYHQGKDMAEVNKLTAQTLTLAKITGMDYERATSDLTAALNAYNIAAEDAVRVTDTIAAMDTNAAISSEELMTALTKTASIAANAGMSLESTEVFLTKMIETTREAPENLGTALKTIIARFGEVKQEIDGEVIELADINRVDTALKSIGISLLDTAGQIRDLDGVFMELSSKWDDLDRNTQRYIATIAAGSRQQSRFIAMMEDYDRTLELTEIAQNSAGLGARQLAKSQESIETSVNRLKSTWQEFYSSLITSGMIKGVLELANGVLSLVNKLNDVSPLLGTIVAALAIWAVKTQIADKLVLKLGQSIGEGMGKTSGFTSMLTLLSASLDETKRKAILASEGVDEYTKSLVRAQVAEEGVGDVNFHKMPTSEKMSVFKEKGFLDENGKITSLGREYHEFNSKSKIKKITGKTISPENFLSYKQGKENTLTKLLGKEGAAKYLKETGGLSGTKAGLKGIGTAMKAGTKGLLASAGSALSSIVGSLGAILTTLGPILAVVGAITAAFVVWKKFFAASLDDTKKIEKLSKSQEEYNKTLQEYNDLKEKAKVIEKYSNRQNLSAEQLQEQQEAAKALVNEYPELLNYIDEEGNYYLKDAEAIQAVIDKKQELLDQEATNYTELRLKYAQEGIYADETTSAGKTMKNIQSYAASLDKDQLKESAKTIDAEGTAFNSSQYKKMMKAFGEGKKFSFDEKDMSNLFEGNIGEDNWNEFLEAVKENPMILESEEDLAKALKDTGAYSKGNAKQVAEAFMKMNEENGKLFSQLITNAAEEYSQIEISYAEIQIEKGDFAEDLSSEVKEGLSEVALQQAIENAGGEDKWKKLKDEDKQNYISEATEDIVKIFENLSKRDIQGINSAFSSKNVGGLKFSQATSIDFKATTVEGQRKALETFWGQLPIEIQRQLPLETIQNGSDEVIKTLFKVITNSLEGQDPKELWKGIQTDFLVSAKMFGKEKNANVFLSAFRGEISNLSLDQIQALSNATGNMSIEQIYPYLQRILGAYGAEYRKNGAEDASELFNTLLKTDFSSISGISKATEELKKFGWTAEMVAQFGVDAMNGIDNISLDNFDTTVEDAKAELERLTSGLEGVTALMNGTASIEQLGSYMNTMMSVWTEAYGAAKAGDMMAELSESIVATGDGFQIGAENGLEYAGSLVNITKEAIITKIALLELKTEQENLSEEEKANAQATIAYLKQYYAYVDAQHKKSIQNGISKDLEKAKEAADKLLESMKNFVNWLREYDRYANLDGVISSLEEEFDHVDFELNFTTNADVVAKDIKDKINNINTRISANQGGIAAAENEQAMWRDVISKRNSNYVSFDESGNAIVNAKKLQVLQEEISNADEYQQAILQAKYDEIMDNVDAYNKSKDKVEDYTKALEDNFSELKEVLSDTYETVIKTEEKLIQVRQEAEDRELDAVKKKYEAIKDENDKYLDGIRKLVDEERKIRDRADREQDVKDKEKKLAMMKMDTSGIYKRDIQSLEKELEQDYRNLEDNAIDDAIEKLEQQFSAEAERLDKEIEYFDNYLAYKREHMTEYNEWANQLIMQGSDAVLTYLQANDQEYYTGTAAQKAAWSLEWNNAVNQAVGANQIMGESLFNSVKNNLDACTLAAGGFKQGVEEYSRLAIANNGQIEGTVDSLKGYYENLAEGVSGVSEALQTLKLSYDNAAGAARDLAAAQAAVTGVGPDPKDIQNKVDELKDNVDTKKGKPKEMSAWKDTKGIDNYVNAYDLKKYTPTEEEWSDGKYTYQKFIYTEDGKSPKEVWFNKLSINGLTKKPDFGALWYKAKYATGGLADYTGPAWLDGTKSKPEAVLNPLQTKHFIEFVNVLDSIFSKNNLIQTPTGSTQLSDSATYNFTINVDQMANDYDVDKLISRIEEKMVKASQYRNVNIVKKTK